MDLIISKYWEKISDHLYKHKENITDTSYDDEESNWFSSAEDDSWWFSYRANVIFSLLNKFFNRDKEVVDIGAGNGFTSEFIQSRGYDVVAIEPTATFCKRLVNRGVNTVLNGVVDENSIRDESIFQFVLLDVLEHIENDDFFLDLLHRKVAPNGLGIITVPAIMKLWSSEDDFVHHFRRYTIEDMKKKLEDNGFEIVIISYYFQFLFLPILLGRVALEKMGLLKPQHRRTQEERNKIVKKQFSKPKGLTGMALNLFEAQEMDKIVRGMRISYGSSIYAVVKKR